MLVTVPVFAVTVDDLGERGAHYVAYKDFQGIVGSSGSSSSSGSRYTSVCTSQTGGGPLAADI